MALGAVEPLAAAGGADADLGVEDVFAVCWEVWVRMGSAWWVWVMGRRSLPHGCLLLFCVSVSVNAA